MRSAEQNLPVARNTALLAAALAVNSAVLQLVAAVSSLTFVLVTGIEGLLGLGPAIFLCSSAMTASWAGRAMDRFGRVPVLATGFIVGATGCGLTALGLHLSSVAPVVAGFTCIGAASATANLARTAAGDMYPPERRARGISYVLFGSVFGAVLGPSVFSPIFRHRDIAASALVVPWLAAGGIALAGLCVVLAVRPDPKRIAELIGGAGARDDSPAAPLREILGRPGVVPAMVAGIASFAVMVAVMNLAGYVVVEHRHHAQHLIFPIIGAHVLGMYGLMPVIGTLIDRFGRMLALTGGLAVMAVSNAGLLWFADVPTTAVLLYGLGLGWNFSFVAATAQLADCARASERGRLLGVNDTIAGLTGAAFVLLGGYALDAAGISALALGSAAAALAPIGFVILRTRALAPAPESP